jgi:hypothetical protein
MTTYRIVEKNNGRSTSFTVQVKETFLCFWRWTHNINVYHHDSNFGTSYMFTDTTFSSIEEAKAKLESIISVSTPKKVSEKVVYAVTVSDEKTIVTLNLRETDQNPVYL